MKCKKSKEKIVLYLYGELSKKEKAEVESHIKECPECSRDFAYTKKVFKVLDEAKEEIPEADWEKCWGEIGNGTEEKSGRQKRFLFLPQWAFATAAVMLIFIAGIFAGKYWFFPGQKSPLQQTVSSESLKPLLKEYFDSLKPVLVEYANYTPSEKGEETITMDKEVARGLLLENLLLRRIVAKFDPSLGQFLEDVDIVLKEIANLNKEDRRTPSLIRELIHQREILFRMEILEKI